MNKPATRTKFIATKLNQVEDSDHIGITDGDTYHEGEVIGTFENDDGQVEQVSFTNTESQYDILIEYTDGVSQYEANSDDFEVTVIDALEVGAERRTVEGFINWSEFEAAPDITIEELEDEHDERDTDEVREEFENALNRIPHMMTELQEMRRVYSLVLANELTLEEGMRCLAEQEMISGGEFYLEEGL